MRRIHTIITKPHPGLAVFLFVILLMVTGCARPTQPLIVQQQIVVVEIPEGILSACPTIKREDLPRWQSMTDGEAAATIARLFRANQQCANTIQQIRQFTAEAKARAVQQNGAQR